MHTAGAVSSSNSNRKLSTNTTRETQPKSLTKTASTDTTRQSERAAVAGHPLHGPTTSDRLQYQPALLASTQHSRTNNTSNSTQASLVSVPFQSYAQQSAPTLSLNDVAVAVPVLQSQPQSQLQNQAPGLGDRGAKVETLQQNLLDRGYSPGPVDGIFGAQTLAALDAFQTNEIEKLTDTMNRLPTYARSGLSNEIGTLQQERQDNVAGMVTFQRLNFFTAAAPDPASSPVTPAATPTLTNSAPGLGDSGANVTELQEQLIDLGYMNAGKADGKFGTETLSALRLFQQDQIAGMEERLEQSLPPGTRSAFQRDLQQLRTENNDGVAGTQTQVQLDAPLEIPDRVEAIREAIESFVPDFSRRTDQQKAQITEDLNLLVSGNGNERLSAALSLAGNLDQQQLRSISGRLGVSDSRVSRILSNSALFSSAAVLTDSNSSDTEKLIAYGELAQALGAITDGRISDVLKPYMQSVRGATSVVKAWDTWNDPNASAEDKAKSIITAVSELSKTAALLPPDKAKIFGRVGNIAKVATAATTLLNADATAGEKALAVSQIVAAIPGLKTDYDAISKLLKGHVDPNQLNRIFDNLPAKYKLPSVLSDALDPRTLDQLTHVDANNLLKLAKNLDQTAGASGVEALGTTLGKLDITGVRDFSRFANQLEGRALELFVRSTEHADARVLETALTVLKRVDSSVVKNLSRVLDFTAGALDKFGVRVGKEVAEKLLKAFGKALPVVGAGVAVYDAVEMGSKALDTSLPADLRYLALTGTKINVADAVYSVFEPLIAAGTGGLGVAPDIALAGTTLAIDLVLTHEEGRLAELGNNYQAPDWIGHANVGSAIASADLAGFYGIYGFSAGNAQIKESLAAGGEMAISSAEGLARLAGEGVQHAQEAITELLLDGGPAADFLISAISQLPLGPELATVLNRLDDAGDAGKAALQGLADSGVDLAGDILNGIWNTINPFGR